MPYRILCPTATGGSYLLSSSFLLRQIKTLLLPSLTRRFPFFVFTFLPLSVHYTPSHIGEGMGMGLLNPILPPEALYALSMLMEMLRTCSA